MEALLRLVAVVVGGAVSQMPLQLRQMIHFL